MSHSQQDRLPVVTKALEWVQSYKTRKVDVVLDDYKVSDVVRWVEWAAGARWNQNVDTKTSNDSYWKCKLQPTSATKL